MTSEEEWVRSVLRKAAKEQVQTYLKTQEYSSKVLTRIDAKAIDQEIERMADEIMARLVQRLKEKGFVGGASAATEEEFTSLFKSTMEGYLVSLQGD